MSMQAMRLWNWVFAAVMILLFVVAVTAEAQEPVCNADNCEVRLQWILPTEDINDNPIPATGLGALDRISVGWYICGDGPMPLSNQTFTDFPPVQTSATIPYPNTPGAYCFGVYARNADTTCTPQVNCRWSDQSDNVVRRTIVVIPPADSVRPKPPTNVIIIVQ